MGNGAVSLFLQMRGLHRQVIDHKAETYTRGCDRNGLGAGCKNKRRTGSMLRYETKARELMGSFFESRKPW